MVVGVYYSVNCIYYYQNQGCLKRGRDRLVCTYRAVLHRDWCGDSQDRWAVDRRKRLQRDLAERPEAEEPVAAESWIDRPGWVLHQ